MFCRLFILLLLLFRSTTQTTACLCFVSVDRTIGRLRSHQMGREPFSWHLKTSDWQCAILPLFCPFTVAGWSPIEKSITISRAPLCGRMVDCCLSKMRIVDHTPEIRNFIFHSILAANFNSITASVYLGCWKLGAWYARRSSRDCHFHRRPPPTSPLLCCQLSPDETHDLWANVSARVAAIFTLILRRC